MNKFIDFWRKTFNEPFKIFLVISLVILGIVLLFAGPEPVNPAAGGGELEIHFFYLPSCSHCEDQEVFNEKLASTYPTIHFTYHDTSQTENSALLSQMVTELGLQDEPGVPVTIFGGLVFRGWESEATTGQEIETAIKQCLAGECPKQGDTTPTGEATLPIIGKIKLSDYSLPALAVIIGLIDGFNPCAMWVLAYLISIIVTLNDRARIWLLVGSFVLASGVLYFLFMTAWLNAFLFIGYSRIITIIIGLVALGAGILSVRDLIKTRGAVVCKVGDEESRKKTIDRIKKVVLSPLTLATIAGIVALAFVVNSIEFVCSSALPAIFTHVLSVSDLTTFQHYAYILLYDFCFMLDDLIIFGLAAFAMTSSFGDRYARYSKPVGAVTLLALGVILLFGPNWLP
ncbi:MAG: hypothetical protein PHU08_04880 [Dehalococcoidales bacterium]|nr:hypothetical protein [Dehalococcoidales bacterium]